MTTDAHTLGDRLAQGRDALARGAWAEARDRFEEALEDEGSGEAWEGLGWAGYWLHDAELTVRSREHAYQAFEGLVTCLARVASRPGWPRTSSSSGATTPSPAAGSSGPTVCSMIFPPAPTMGGWP